MTLLSSWLEALHPDGAAIARTLLRLPTRPTYNDAEAGAHSVGLALAACEFSERTGGLRLAYTLDPARLRTGDLTRALRELGVVCPELPVRATEALRLRYPGLGVLIGLDALGERRRGKIYLQPDKSAPTSAYRRPLRLFLEAAQVDPDGVERTVARLAGKVAFAAVDLLPTSTPCKVYLEVDRQDAERSLVELGATALRERVRDLPDAAFGGDFACILSVRWTGTEKTDVTLHVGAGGLGEGWLGPLGPRWRELQARAAAMEAGLTLRYLSWMADVLRPTFYYGVAANR